MPAKISPYGKCFEMYIDRDIRLLFKNGTIFNGTFAASIHTMLKNPIQNNYRLVRTNRTRMWHRSSSLHGTKLS